MVDESLLARLQNARYFSLLADECTDITTIKDAVVAFVEALGTWVDESLLARLQNARYFSLLADECTDITTIKDAVVAFVEALGTWVDESLLARLQNARYFSLLADESTDITTIEELSVVYRWAENGLPVEHFIEIIPLKKADAQTIYATLVDCLKVKGVQISKLIGMGFDGAATFSRKHKGVQTLLKSNSPHSIFVHCHCHLLQLACVQAANSTPGIKHVYITLTTLCKFFQYSPK